MRGGLLSTALFVSHVPILLNMIQVMCDVNHE
jgi:hypothetical protein